MAVETEKKPKIAGVLQQLIDGRKIRPSDLAAQTGLPHNTIYMILNGRVRVPNGATLTAFADYFNVSVDYLLSREPADHPNQAATACIQKPMKGLIFIPIIQWSNIAHWIKESNWASHNKKSWGKQERRYIEYSDKGSTAAFALEVNKLYLVRVFPAHSLIIVDPKSKVNDGDYVIVKGPKKDINLWQMKEFNQKHYIQAIGIKSDAIELKSPLAILGKVVECRTYYP